MKVGKIYSFKPIIETKTPDNIKVLIIEGKLIITQSPFGYFLFSRERSDEKTIYNQTKLLHIKKLCDFPLFHKKEIIGDSEKMVESKIIV